MQQRVYTMQASSEDLDMLSNGNSGEDEVTGKLLL